MAYYLPEEVDFFPHPLYADDDGLLAMGSRLSVENILLAYQWGIFPWTSEGEPLLWWYTFPRCVLVPSELKVSRSMRPYLNSDKWRWSIDEDFRAVMSKCKQKERKGQAGTWIFGELESVFMELHEMGYAHSVEVWEDDRLIGGLYGLSLGNIFFGESMFADESNASKYGFIHFIRWLERNGTTLVDCQQETAHLKSLGAKMIPSESFYKRLKENIFLPTRVMKWTA